MTSAGESTQIPKKKHPLVQVLSVALTVVVLWLVFGVIIPRIANYAEIWDSITSMHASAAIALIVAGLALLVLMSLVLSAALPGLRPWAAISTQPASMAVGAVVPGATVPARALFLRPFGITTANYTRSYAAAGLGTTLCVLLMTVVGLVIMLSVPQSSEDTSGMRTTAVIVCIVAVAIAGVVIALITSPAACRWCARAAIWLIGRSAWLSRKVAADTWESAITTWRSDTVQIVRERKARLVGVVLAVFWLQAALMIGCMYACGLPTSALGILTGLGTFTIARLLLSVPLTPGGVGVLELGYSAIFGAMVAEQFDDSVVGGVLLFRALTYVMPVFLGGILLLVIRVRAMGRDRKGTKPERL
ncbi:lysylphosphatidylglycerol synthase-like protein [Antricoccus suffuscus]|uniref:Lysylphosphatidylglycerol synthase-like protein n=1 Tax=Antricoccus suffuscus TaxID=1629062 RepID=A0A2T1A682_9ACTN|nr:YbhN family protein [Antricoccus suffuscus]PRZ44096.1 lysylphosphatidylglycerol synthase-like protein [Antricoccus suffuscus]